MALGDAEALANFFERNRRGGLEFLRGHACSAQLGGKSHRESTGVGGGEQFFGIGADAVFEAGAIRVLRLLEDAAVGGDRAFAVLQTALPKGRCFALHEDAPSVAFGGFER